MTVRKRTARTRLLRGLDFFRLMRRYTFVLLMLATTACQYDPFAHEFTKVRAETGALVGVYELDDESTEMRRRKYKLVPPSSRFVLRSDGTFKLFIALDDER